MKVHLCAMLHGIIHKVSHLFSQARHAHGSTVYGAAPKSWPLPHPLRHFSHLIHKVVVDGFLDKEALGSGTVLAAAEEGSFHSCWYRLQKNSAEAVLK